MKSKTQIQSALICLRSSWQSSKVALTRYLKLKKIRWNAEVSAIYGKKKEELAQDTKDQVAALEGLIDKFDTKNKELDKLLEASGNTALAGGLIRRGRQRIQGIQII